MTRLARTVLIVVGVVAITVAAAVAARQIVLAAVPDISWPLPSWWQWVVEPGHPWRAGVAAACAGLAALVCLVLAARVVRRPAPGIKRIDLFGEGGTTTIEAGPVDRYLSRALTRHAAEIEQARVTLYEDGERYDALAVVSARPCDLARLHPRLLQVVSDDLRRATGKEIGWLEIEVDRFILDDRGDS